MQENYELKGDLKVTNLKSESAEGTLKTFQTQFDKYFTESMLVVWQDFDQKKDFNTESVSEKMRILKDTYKQRIEELRTKMDELSRTYTEDKLKLKEDYQSRIDEFFTQSNTQMQKLMESENQNEVMAQKLTFAKLESDRYKELIRSLLQSSNIEVGDGFSIEKGVNDLLIQIKENRDSLENLKQEV